MFLSSASRKMLALRRVPWKLPITATCRYQSTAAVVQAASNVPSTTATLTTDTSTTTAITALPVENLPPPLAESWSSMGSAVVGGHADSASADLVLATTSSAMGGLTPTWWVCALVAGSLGGSTALAMERWTGSKRSFLRSGERRVQHSMDTRQLTRLFQESKDGSRPDPATQETMQRLHQAVTKREKSLPFPYAMLAWDVGALCAGRLLLSPLTTWIHHGQPMEPLVSGGMAGVLLPALHFYHLGYLVFGDGAWVGRVSLSYLTLAVPRTTLPLPHHDPPPILIPTLTLTLTLTLLTLAHARDGTHQGAANQVDAPLHGASHHDRHELLVPLQRGEFRVEYGAGRGGVVHRVVHCCEQIADPYNH